LIADISYSDKTILICPLDWGLGHAARCVPLIKQLQKQNNRIIVGCTSWQKEFLQGELNGVEYTSLFGYEVRYSENISVGLKILLQSPRLFSVVRREHAWLEQFLQEHKVDVVISDNRFGLYNKKVESVFITHQVFVRAPFLQRWINKINLSYIKRFDKCWVPDHADPQKSLSGALSHDTDLPANLVYIGPLSRFSESKATEKEYEVLLLLSGVEPQRLLLENKLVQAFDGAARVALVRGAQGTGRAFPSNFTVFNRINNHELLQLMMRSQTIVCRSGYSTLMDLDAMKLRALLIPTPGQTEQEYLARYWHEQFGFETLAQADISRERLAYLASAGKTPQPQTRSV
jgi:UDP:flavonoid glycosyltransferase YjiC (YdhE family)